MIWLSIYGLCVCFCRFFFYWHLVVDQLLLYTEQTQYCYRVGYTGRSVIYNFLLKFEIILRLLFLLHIARSSAILMIIIEIDISSTCHRRFKDIFQRYKFLVCIKNMYLPFVDWGANSILSILSWEFLLECVDKWSPNEAIMAGWLLGNDLAY